MFERWLGAETVPARRARYLDAARFGNATADDLLAALSQAAGQATSTTPFRSFLFQPGVPLVEVALACEGDHARFALNQSRYLPLGCKGDPKKVWQIPVCVRYRRRKGRGAVHAADRAAPPS